ncbi:rod shape-determining protein MreC [Candidatus Roizmanbacteria bacterium]|nr:rod shape-determining protein MreC [Candidatus Roizmanbacteria bacterium]
MQRQRIQLTQLFLLWSAISLVLLLGDTYHIVDGVRSFVEEKIVALRMIAEKPEGEGLLAAKVLSLEQERNNLQEENQQLRKQLQAPLPASFAFIPARVIAIEEKSNDKVMRIAAGSKQGVATGMPVVRENILIGSVIAVTPYIGTVRLLGSPQSKVAVSTKIGAQGLVVGSDNVNASSTAMIDRVLHTTLLTPGDLIVTSGEDQLPADLLVGKVEHVIKEAREPFQKAEISLLVKPEELSRIFIIKEE